MRVIRINGSLCLSVFFYSTYKFNSISIIDLVVIIYFFVCLIRHLLDRFRLVLVNICSIRLFRDENEHFRSKTFCFPKLDKHEFMTFKCSCLFRLLNPLKSRDSLVLKSLISDLQLIESIFSEEERMSSGRVD